MNPADRINEVAARLILELGRMRPGAVAKTVVDPRPGVAVTPGTSAGLIYLREVPLSDEAKVMFIDAPPSPVSFPDPLPPHDVVAARLARPANSFSPSERDVGLLLSECSTWPRLRRRS